MHPLFPGCKTLDHLLVQCVYNQEIWFKFLRQFDWHQHSLVVIDDFVPWWSQVHMAIPKARCKVFNSVVYLVAWCLWLQRNDKVFRNGSLLPLALLCVITSCCNLWCRANLVDRSSLLFARVSVLLLAWGSPCFKS
jgi:hypothetical protein